jgi:hypothetical protein
MVFKRITVFCFTLLLFSVAASAQNGRDTLNIVTKGQDTLKVNDAQTKEVVIDTLENRPNTAALYSAVLPGLGQAYNNQYWKIPIIYGGGLVIGYYINYNNKLYKQYRDGLLAIKDGDDRTEPFDPSLSKTVYEKATDYWRRNRDLLVIGAILFYVVNIVDAHVDAHLALFTVDDDISLNIEPSFDQTAMQTNLVGLSLKLKF